jgi:hypothetical protein
MSDEKHTTAYAASLVVHPGPARLFKISGYSSNVGAQFIQVHDAASLPADAAVPEVVRRVGATSDFEYDFGDGGRRFENGIVICNSSTGPTKTIGSADCWFEATFRPA